MSAIARDIFKAYDIRGIVGKTLTNEAAYLIGKAIATKAVRQNIKKIALGRDGRLSGPELMENISRGFTESGLDVLNHWNVITANKVHQIQRGDRLGHMLGTHHRALDHQDV